MHAGEPFVLEALAAGALGYVLKDTTATELVRAINEAAAGRRYLSPPLSDRAVEAYMGRSHDRRRGDRYGALTTREREVLQLVAEGLTSHAIAQRLGVSRRTVESHRANLMRKLGVPTTAALVRLVAERGLLPESTPVRRKTESA
jgi:DNA-binding NarL/FixJ family response regulator